MASSSAPRQTRAGIPLKCVVRLCIEPGINFYYIPFGGQDYRVNVCEDHAQTLSDQAARRTSDA